MRLKTNINQLGQIYIPKKEREKIQLDTDEIDYIADAKVILLLPTNFSAKDALKSLKIIRAHLKHEAELEAREKVVNLMNKERTSKNLVKNPDKRKMVA